MHLIDEIFTEAAIQKAMTGLKRKARIAINRNPQANNGHYRMSVIKQIDLEKRTNVIRLLKKKTYNPNLLTLVQIPKNNWSNEKRPISIATAQDAWVQATLLNHLEPLFLPRMSEYSYGFWSGRGQFPALKQVRDYIEQGNGYVIDLDFSKCFDSISHDRLLSELGKYEEIQPLIWLIQKFITTGNRKSNSQDIIPRISGLPQGMPLSPLLMNLFLDPLDQWLESSGIIFVRFADDLVILCQNEVQAQHIFEQIETWVESNLGLTFKIKPDRPFIYSLNDKPLAYLSYNINESGLSIPARQLNNLKTRINEKRDSVKSIELLNNSIRGFIEYYQLVLTGSERRRWKEDIGSFTYILKSIDELLHKEEQKKPPVGGILTV